MAAKQRSARRHRSVRGRPRLIHLTTVDSSLVALLLPQLRAFSQAGYEVIGVSASGPDVAQLEAAGIRHVALHNSTRARAPRRDLAVLWEFWRLCRRLRPDIVHTHNPKPGLYGRVLARLAGVPLVVNTVHGLYATENDPLLKRIVVYGLESFAARFSDAELLQNEEDLPVLRRAGVPARKLRVLGNGIDLARFEPTRWPDSERAEVRSELGLGLDAVVIGTVGRLVAEKGYVELFQALPRLGLPRDGVKVLAVAPADPSKPDALSEFEIERAKEMGVKFLGWRDDVDRLYLAMDLFVLASHREGFPRAAMEAAAMGLPIVATDVRGCRQVVDHAASGFLVRLGDVDELAQRLGELVGDADLRRRFGDRARRKALTSFDDRQQIALTLRTYDRLGAFRTSSATDASPAVGRGG
jgi:glycosyltransferase involved in cell wall biosynthesis